MLRLLSDTDFAFPRSAFSFFQFNFSIVLFKQRVFQEQEVRLLLVVRWTLLRPGIRFLRTMDPHSRAPKKNTSHGNEVLPQGTTHLIQRPCYQRGSPVPRSSRQLDHTATSWPSERDANCSGMAMSPVHQVWLKRGQGRRRKRREDSSREWIGLEFATSQRAVEDRKMEKTGCEIICGAPATFTVKG